jgi:HNH endonuclease
MLVNKYHIEEDVAYIFLTKGQTTMIDVADLEKVLLYTWMASYNPTIDGYYCMRRTGTGGTMYLHRYLLDAPKGLTVDHINHDTLDNRQSNLRLVTNQKNNVNRNGAFSSSKTGIRGVSTHKCKPSGLMYVFRCHCVTCKVTKYFPHTEEGLAAARAFSEAHYASINK